MAQIYRLSDDRGQCYYGSTTQKDLNKRLQQHRSNAKNRSCSSWILFEPKPLLQPSVVKIEAVENIPTLDAHMKARERWWIQNHACVNKNIPGRSKKESQEAYLKKHPDKRKETQRRWRQKNPTYQEDYIKKKKANKIQVIWSKSESDTESESDQETFVISLPTESLDFSE